MAKGSAASPSGLAPAVPPPSLRLDVRKRKKVEWPVPGDVSAEGEIQYPIAPESVSWPRVFPQL
jgi:hypothetical protein